jgi:hypothetical protein
VGIRAAMVCAVLSLATLVHVSASPVEPPEVLGQVCQADARGRNLWAGAFVPVSVPAPQPGLVTSRLFDSVALQSSGSPRAVPVEYSDGYRVRARIHKVASFVTLPIFASMYVVGQDLYKHPGESDSKVGLHNGMVTATAALFAVNTVTGVWNLWEGRENPVHRKRRLIHSALMLVADAGFVATGLLAPGDDDESSNSGRRSAHRATAFTSMGVATVGYLMMLFHRD